MNETKVHGIIYYILPKPLMKANYPSLTLLVSNEFRALMTQYFLGREKNTKILHVTKQPYNQ